MSLPNTAHSSRHWRIHELTRDFRLEDVWELPTPAGPNDFPRLVQLIASQDPSRSSFRAVAAEIAKHPGAEAGLRAVPRAARRSPGRMGRRADPPA